MIPKYRIITPFKNGFATYQADELFGFLNMEGKQLTPPAFGLAWDFKEGLARVIAREGVCFINKTGGLEFVSPDFDVRDFYEDLARIPL